MANRVNRFSFHMSHEGKSGKLCQSFHNNLDYICIDIILLQNCSKENSAYFKFHNTHLYGLETVRLRFLY